MNTRSLCAAALAASALVVAALPTVATAQARFDFDRTPGHLSKQVVPQRYELRFDLDPARDSFGGEARIALRVRQALPSFEVHASQLTASSARLLQGKATRELQVTPLPATQTWRLTPTDGQPIAPGDYRLAIDYTGRVQVSGEGLFVAPYTAQGRAERMLATQLEAIHARMVFPGFDEPAFRAPFEITVRAPKTYEVFSNMPQAGVVVDGDHAVHRFPATPPMPSYLVSVTVGHFDQLAGRVDGLPLRILTAPGKAAQGRYALQVTEQVMPYYRSYFGVPYAMPKLDQMAVPSTRWGAMEDWGLISYAENALLVDPERSSPRTYRGVFGTVAHEIAHQWFGDLVTAASWEEIWLNEAFATWLQNKTSDHFNPAWKVPLESRRWIDNAMTRDAGTATRPIRSGPVRETAVHDVFDSITYAKGGAVLTMLEQWMGPDVFRRGLGDYMRGQRLSNATAADLWHYMGKASRRDVAAVAASWTDQPGFPLVEVASACEAGRQRLHLTQHRFSRTAGGESTALWKIPVRYARAGRVDTVLFDTPQRTLDIGTCSVAPVIVNAGGVGYYRVSYEPAAFEALTRGFAALGERDRIALLSDTFATMQAGRTPLAAYMALLNQLPKVNDGSRTVLWALAHAQLGFIDRAMTDRPAQAQLRAAARALLRPQLDRLGWTPKPDEDRQTAELRGDLISALTAFDDAETAAHATRAFDDDDAGTRLLPPSLRAAVTYATGVRADRAHFDRLLEKVKSARGEEERWMYARALAAGRDPQRAEELLKASVNGLVPANIAAELPGLVATSSPFGELAYRFALANWDPLSRLAGTWGQPKVLPGAASGFNDPARAETLLADQRRLVGPDGDSSASQAAEDIRLRAAVREREAPTLEKLRAD